MVIQQWLDCQWKFNEISINGIKSVFNTKETGKYNEVG